MSFYFWAEIPHLFVLNLDLVSDDDNLVELVNIVVNVVDPYLISADSVTVSISADLVRQSDNSELFMIPQYKLVKLISEANLICR